MDILMVKKSIKMAVSMDILSILQEQNPWWAHSSARPRAVQLACRDAFQPLLDAISDLSSRRATVLMGPRQVGKTTLMKQVLGTLLDQGWPVNRIVFFDFADDRLASSVDPREILRALPMEHGADVPLLLFLDELQRYPGWADWLRREVDSGDSRVFASGSAMSLLSKGGETGQGRWNDFKLEGLTFLEALRLSGLSPDDQGVMAPERFSRYLETGGFPEFTLREPSSESRRLLRSDIAEKAILRDLLSAGVEVERVKHLFVYLVGSSGDIFNAVKRATDLAADRKSVAEWLRLLQQTGLVVDLPRFIVSQSASKRLRPQPKVYAMDHGLIEAFWAGPRSTPDSQLLPKVYEAMVFQHLRSLRAEDPELRLSYFREKDYELDFVVESADRRVGIEVTSSSRFDGKWSRLEWVRKRAGLDRILVIHGGRSARDDGASAEVPLRTFALNPRVQVLGGTE